MFHPALPTFMPTKRLLSLALAVVMPLGALTAQDLSLPATISSWKTSGPAVTVQPDTGAVTLPTNAQLVRAYPDSRVTVHLVSRAYFQAKSGNWPALVVGPAVLTFMPDGAGGGIVLLGDKILTLPQAIPLGADGRCLKPIDLSLDYDHGRNEATLVLNGASYPVPATANEDQITVAISAGAEASWTLDILEVTPGTSTAGANSASGKSTATDQTKSGTAISSRQAYENAKKLFAAGKDDEAEAALEAANHNKPGTAAWYLQNAHALVRLAISFSQKGDTATADRIIKRALLQTALTISHATNKESDTTANAFELEGFVYDRFIGDWDKAKDRYRQATAVLPEGSSAKAALKRLENTEQQTALKLKH